MQASLDLLTALKSPETQWRYGVMLEGYALRPTAAAILLNGHLVFVTVYDRASLPTAQPTAPCQPRPAVLPASSGQSRPAGLPLARREVLGRVGAGRDGGLGKRTVSCSDRCSAVMTNLTAVMTTP